MNPKLGTGPRESDKPKPQRCGNARTAPSQHPHATTEYIVGACTESTHAADQSLDQRESGDPELARHALAHLATNRAQDDQGAGRAVQPNANLTPQAVALAAGLAQLLALAKTGGLQAALAG